MSKPKDWRPSTDKRWLASVRSDLDSHHKDWAVKTGEGSISKLEAIGRYLDILLTDLGESSKKCECCGQELIA